MSLLLQVKMDNASDMADKTAEEGFSLLSLMFKGGLIMIPLAILSIIAIYLIIERALYIAKQGKVNRYNIAVLNDKLKSGDIKGAADLCKTTPTAWGRIFNRGVKTVKSGAKMSEIEKTIEDTAQAEMGLMEKNMSYLSLIAGAAPLLGFIGTIMGVIKIFYDITITADITIGSISEGLYQKMITSAAGLVVGIIAFSGYQLLNASIDRFASKIQNNAISFKDTLQDPQD